MKNHTFALVLAAVASVLAGRVACPADAVGTLSIRADEIGKCGLGADTVSRMLALDATTFDQSLQGFRLLGARQCYVDAALMIDLYLTQNSEKLEQRSYNIMKFHAGQMYAYSSAALYPVAVSRMQESVSDLSSPNWRAYVAATVAYLRRDLAALKMQRTVLAATSDGQAEVPNMVVVDRLKKCFDRPYAEAYSPQLCLL
jgi:hypothetical protein